MSLTMHKTSSCEPNKNGAKEALCGLKKHLNHELPLLGASGCKLLRRFEFTPTPLKCMCGALLSAIYTRKAHLTHNLLRQTVGCCTNIHTHITCNDKHCALSKLCRQKANQHMPIYYIYDILHRYISWLSDVIVHTHAVVLMSHIFLFPCGPEKHLYKFSAFVFLGQHTKDD